MRTHLYSRPKAGGVSTIEYALLLVLIGAVSCAAVMLLGRNISELPIPAFAKATAPIAGVVLSHQHAR